MEKNTDSQPIDAANIESSISEMMRQKLTPILDEIDKLRNLNLELSQEMPTITVIGLQSVGKSSVLEQISGIPLPRGNHTVTRCPLQLEMRNISQNYRDVNVDSDSAIQISSIKASFRDKDGQENHVQLQSALDIENFVRESQPKMLKEGEQITSNLIKICIHSKNSPNLTLVDLPGLVHVSQKQEGEEKFADKVTVTKNLIKQYIKSPNTLIVVVAHANTDEESILPLNFAAQVDQNYNRTILVLTHCDLISPGDERIVSDLVMNRGRIRIKKGTYLVRCRSQRDMENNMTLSDAMIAEKNILNERFPNLPDKFLGCKALKLVLVRELFENINKNVSQLRIKLSNLLKMKNQELEMLCLHLPESDEEKHKLVFQRVQTFCDRFTENCLGKEVKMESKKSQLMKFLRSTADVFERDLEKITNLNSFPELYVQFSEYIEKKMARELITLVDIFDILEVFINDECLDKIDPLCYDFVSNINNQISLISEKISREVFQALPFLHTKIMEYMAEQQELCVKDCREMLKVMINAERRLFTQNKLFSKILSRVEIQDIFEGTIPKQAKPVPIKERPLPEAPRDGIESEDETFKETNDSLTGNDEGNEYEEEMMKNEDPYEVYTKRLSKKVNKKTDSKKDVTDQLININHDHTQRLLKSAITYLQIFAQRIGDYVPLIVREKQLIDLTKMIKQMYIERFHNVNPVELLKQTEDHMEKIQIVTEQRDVIKNADKKLFELTN